ncbi:aroma-sacti cluster domain-containing protein [Streptomyces sp. NPDC006207]
MPIDPLQALRDAGHPVDLLSDRQQEVLRGLSEEEIAVLNGLKDRLDAVADEVEAHDIKLL